MGMWTELILGAKLKKETPKYVIETLRYLVGDLKRKPKKYPAIFKEAADPSFPLGNYKIMFTYSHWYFAVDKPFAELWYDSVSGCYKINTRSNIRNYDNRIEIFLKWLKPYIVQGSGSRDMYAIVTYEEDSDPTIYYLKNNLKK